MSDADLVRRTLAGQKTAFEELVRRWAPRVLAVCHSKVGRYHAAEDLAQEALLRSYRALASLADPEKFGGWLYGIAVRTCLDWLKAKERTQVTFSALGAGVNPADASGPHGQPEASDLLVDEEERAALLSEVDRLPDKLRRVLMMFYYDDRSYQEIAGFLGVSAATINARLTQARLLLRERLVKSRKAQRN